MTFAPDPATPVWIFEGRRSLSDPLVLDGALGQCNLLDAGIDQSSLTEQGVDIRIGRIWFGHDLGDDAFGTKGALIHLRFASRPPDADLFRIGNLMQRAILGLRFAPLAQSVTFHVPHVYDLSFAIDPAASSFEWRFQPRLT